MVNKLCIITNFSDIFHIHYGPKEGSRLVFLRLPFNLISEYVTGKRKARTKWSEWNWMGHITLWSSLMKLTCDTSTSRQQVGKQTLYLLILSGSEKRKMFSSLVRWMQRKNLVTKMSDTDPLKLWRSSNNLEGNAFYGSVQNLLFSRLLSENIKIKRHETLISLVLYGWETWSFTVRKRQGFKVMIGVFWDVSAYNFQNRALGKKASREHATILLKMEDRTQKTERSSW
jgi:hypothetical protein